MAGNLFIFNSKKSRRFAGNLIIFLLLLVGIDFLLGSVIEHFFKRTRYGENWPKENWLLSVEFDVVVMGSSRAFRSYIPSVMQEQLPYTVFNAGANGQYLLYAYALQQMLLEQYRPRVIVLDLLPNYVTTAEPVFAEVERMSILAPYADNPEVKTVLTQNRWQETVKLHSRLYRYNSRLLNIADNYFNDPTGFDNGYTSVGKTKFREVNRFLDDLSPDTTVAYDTYRIDILKKFIRSAQDRDVDVVLVFSPTVEPLSQKIKTILQYIARIAGEMNVPMISITCEEYPQFQNREWYMDYIHMNALGAEAYSPIFTQKLEQLLPPHPSPAGTAGGIRQDSSAVAVDYAR